MRIESKTALWNMSVEYCKSIVTVKHSFTSYITPHDVRFSCRTLPSDSLYPGAPLTTQASWLSIYRFCLANKLTDVATKQLLDLVSIHCPKPNACPKSLYLLKSLFGCMETVNTYYCATCSGEVGDTLKGCLKYKCKATSAQVGYFTLLSFESCLKSIVEGLRM